MTGILRRLRGALGHAVAWGIGWFAASMAVLSVLSLAGLFPSDESWSLALYVAANIGVTGLLTGAVFSAFLRAAYLDRPLLSISVPRLSFAAAAIAATCAPLVALAARASAGAPIVFSELLAGAPLAAILGGLSGGGLVFIAQRASGELGKAESAALESEQREAIALLEDKRA